MQCIFLLFLRSIEIWLGEIGRLCEWESFFEAKKLKEYVAAFTEVDEFVVCGHLYSGKQTCLQMYICSGFGP